MPPSAGLQSQPAPSPIRLAGEPSGLVRGLPPSCLRAWRLPGLPAEGAIVRALECEYARTKGLFMAEFQPWENATAPSGAHDLFSCAAEEISSWYRTVPASSVYPDAGGRDYSSLFYSYTDVLQSDGVSEKGPSAGFPATMLLGLILNNASVDAAFPHDAWSTHPVDAHDKETGRLRYQQCAGIRPDYAQARLENLVQRCNTERKLKAEGINRPWRMQNPGKYADIRDGSTAQKVEFSQWVRHSGYTCYHTTREAAEAEQRAYIDLLVRNGTTCEPGPLYNQLQVRYSARNIRGIFFTPGARKEAMQLKRAVELMSSVFGGAVELQMIEAVPTSDFPLRGARGLKLTPDLTLVPSEARKSNAAGAVKSQSVSRALIPDNVLLDFGMDNTDPSAGSLEKPIDETVIDAAPSESD